MTFLRRSRFLKVADQVGSPARQIVQSARELAFTPKLDDPGPCRSHQTQSDAEPGRERGQPVAGDGGNQRQEAEPRDQQAAKDSSVLQRQIVGHEAAHLLWGNSGRVERRDSVHDYFKAHTNAPARKKTVKSP